MALPAITQKPDCDLQIEGLEIVSITSDLTNDIVMSVLSIDFAQKSLLIETDDIATFSGKKVDLEVLPLPNHQVDQAKTLLIKLDF